MIPDFRRSLLTLCRTSAVVALLVVSVEVSADPPERVSRFYGEVTAEGASIPASLEVVVGSGGLELARELVEIVPEAVVYRIDVPGDDPATPEIEGAVEGQILDFRLSGSPLTPTVVWRNGDYQRLDLAAALGADLAVAIDDGREVVTAGESVAYQITVSSGSSFVATGIALSAALPAEAIFVGAGAGGTVVGQEVVWPAFDLEAGASVLRSLDLRVATQVASQSGAFEVEATVLANGDEGLDPDPSNNAARDVDRLDAFPDLIVTLDDGLLEAVPSQDIIYVLGVANHGSRDAVGVQLAQTIPEEVIFLTASEDGGERTPGRVTWPAFELAVGDSREFTVRVRVPESPAPSLIQIESTATATVANGPDLEPADNSASDATVVLRQGDLTVLAVDPAGSATDPQTLAISGSVAVEVANIGTADLAFPFEVMVFDDGDGDALPGGPFDVVLGTVTVDPGPIVGTTAIVPVPVSGTVSFLDNLIYAFVDSTDVISELDENDNIGHSGSSCVAAPVAEAFDPVVELSWPEDGGALEEPLARETMSTPIVVQLDDDNGDGRIDTEDIPDIVFVAANLENIFNPKIKLRAISGLTGDSLWAVDPPVSDGLTFALSGLAAGDLTGDGDVEILVSTPEPPLPPLVGFSNRLSAYDHRGRRLWTSLPYVTHPTGATLTNRDYPSLADLDADGDSEVIIGANVFDHHGNLLWTGSGGQGYQSARNEDLADSGAISVVTDLDLDGAPEVVTGNTAYRADGSIYWQLGLDDGYPGIGNFDADAEPEIVVVARGFVRLHEHDGTVIWGPVALPGVDPEAGGAPTVADFDADGEPEIGVAGSSYYTVFEGDGTPLWQHAIQDESSNQTGSTVFDLDGNGSFEVIYRDETHLRILNGEDGQILFADPLTSFTANEMPVVVDVDGDGQGEIVVTSDKASDLGLDNPTFGLRVYGDRNGNWLGTRGLWNQHAYSIDNVTDDGKIPQVAVHGWLTHNTFRANAAPVGGVFASADVSVSRIRVDLDHFPMLELTARVGNGGAFDLTAGLPVAFYAGEPSSGDLLGVAVLSGDLAPGEHEDVSIQIDAAAGTAFTLHVVAGDDGERVALPRDCRSQNNRHQLALDFADAGLWVTLADGVDSVAPGDEVTYVITVANASPFPRSGITLRDVLPPAVSLVAASDGGSFDGGAVTWPSLTLAAGADATFSLTYRVDEPVPPGVTQLGNQVSAFDDGTAPDVTPLNNVAVDVNQITNIFAQAGGPYVGEEGTPVVFDGSGSASLNGTLVAWAWDFDGDGVFDDGTGPTAEYAFPDQGGYTVSLQVTDDVGEVDVDTAEVTISNVAPVVDAGSDRDAVEGDAVALDLPILDPGLLDSHTATVDWGDGVPETVTVDAGRIRAGRSFADDTVRTVTACADDGEGGQGCDSFELTVDNAEPVVLASAAAVDLTTWVVEELGEPANSDWQVDSGGDGVVQNENSRPAMFYSPFVAVGVTLEFQIAVETTSDDDLIGVALGFQPGDFQNSAAEYLVIDWKQEDQDSSGACQVVPGRRGLAVSRVRGIPASIELFGHVDLDLECADQGGVEELARGATLGDVGWQDNRSYELMVQSTPTTLRVWVDGGLEIDLTGDFEFPGRFAFYNYSQKQVRYSAVRSSGLSLLEGETTRLVLPFSDVGILDTHQGTVDWGDGASSAATVTASNGSGTLTAEHVYAQDGEYTAEACVLDDDDGEGCGEVPATVVNLPPVVDAGADRGLEPGVDFSLIAAFTDPGILDVHSATIDWGDGTIEAGAVVEATGSGTVSGIHTYADNGLYPVTVCVEDEAGARACDSFDLLRDDVALSARPGAVLEGDDGTAMMILRVALNVPTAAEVRVDLATFEGTATLGFDYEPVTATVIFAPGEQLRTVAVPVYGDLEPEGLETFGVALSGATGAEIRDAQSLGRILDDDASQFGYVTLNTPTGDGGLNIDLGAFGDFGHFLLREVFGVGVGDATYDPIGPIGPSTTTYDAALHMRIDGGIQRYLTTGKVVGRSGARSDQGFVRATSTSALSDFTFDGLWLELEQRVQNLMVDGERLGSVLVQRYTVANPLDQAVGFEVVRYIDGDLGFGIGDVIPDGGGRLVTDGREVLFETDLAGTPVDAIDFVGITAEGGEHPSSGRYQVGRYSQDTSAIGRGEAPTDTVFNDGPDADQFVDAGQDFDVVLILANRFVLEPGASTEYETRTFFGSGVPETFPIVNQPPVPDAGGPYTGLEGEVVLFDGSASSDPDGTVVAWDWDMDGDGTFEVNGETPAYTFPDSGTFTITLRVTDDGGEIATAQVAVAIANQPPVVTGSDQAGVEGTPVPLVGITFSDPGVGDRHSAIVDWGDGTVEAAVVDQSEGRVLGSHTYVEDGAYPVEVCVDDGESDPVCLALTAMIANADPELRANAVTDLTTWIDEVKGAPSTPPMWQVSADGQSVEQAANSFPTVFFTPNGAEVAVFEGLISVSSSTGDDDFVGLLMGFDSGDFTNPSAQYLMIDWKGRTQNNFEGVRADVGLALSRVWGTPTRSEYWGHVDLDTSASGIEELQRAATLGGVGWQTDREYAFRVEVDASVRVWVDGVLELDVETELASGRFAFYNYSQDFVTYRGFELAGVRTVEGTEGTLEFVWSDLGILDEHTATVDWGEGTGAEPVAVTQGSGEGDLAVSHVYAQNGDYTAAVCVADDDGGEDCVDVAMTVVNAPPVLDLDGPLDLRVWTAEVLSTPPVIPIWQVSADGLNVEQLTNSWPTVYFDPTAEAVTSIEGLILIDPVTTDDDFVGFTLGFETGDFANPAAEYLLVDWRSKTQSTSTNAVRGLALSRVWGMPDRFEFSRHQDLDDPASGVEELQRAATLGDTDWQTGRDYEFRFAIETERVRVWVDGVLELDLETPLADGRLGFYNYSQDHVIYSGFQRTDRDAVVTIEGSDAELAVTWTDAGVLDLHTATVDWRQGAGPEPAVVVQGAGFGELQASRLFPQDGEHRARVCAADGDGGEDCGEVPVRVLNAAPVLGLDPAPIAYVAEAFEISAQATDPGMLDVLTATVDWGSGPEAVALAPQGAGLWHLVASHTYAQAGLYDVEVCVTDDGGGDACDHLPVDVVSLDPELVVGKLDALVVDLDGDGAADAGDRVLYQMLVTNVGPGTSTSLQLLDAVPADTVIVAGSVVSDVGTVVAVDPVTVDLPDLAQGDSAAVSFEVEVAASLPIEVGELSNQAWISSAELDPVPSDDPDLPGIDDPTLTPTFGDDSLRCVSEPFDQPLPSLWQSALIGDADQGAVEVVGGALQLSGDGTTLYHDDDNGHFLYRDFQGDFRLEVSVTDVLVDEGGQFRKACLMVRAGLDVRAERFMACLVPHFGGAGIPALQFDYRPVAGGAGVTLASTEQNVPPPARVALTRRGDVFTVSYSIDDGLTWVGQLGGAGGTVELNLPEVLQVGMMVASYDAEQTFTVELDDLRLCTPQDVEPVDPGDPPVCDPQQPLDVIYLFDLSSSMTADFADGSGNKLAAARQALTQIHDQLALRQDGSRAALLTFAGSSDAQANLEGSLILRANLTTDLAAVGSSIADLDENDIMSLATTPTSLGLLGLRQQVLPLLDGARRPAVIVVTDGVPNIDSEGRGPAEYSLSEIQELSLRDEQGDFLPWGEVAWLGRFNGSIDTYDGEPLANAMLELERLSSQVPELLIYGVAIHGNGVELGTFNDDLVDYAAWVSGGRSYSASDVASIELETAALLGDLLCDSSGTGALGDRLWNDLDGDGLEDPGEPGLPGTVVDLLDAGLVVIDTTVTDHDGAYLFANLPPGSYTVRVDRSTLPDGTTEVTHDLDGTLTPDQAEVTVLAWQVRRDVDFGYRATSVAEIERPAGTASCVADGFGDGVVTAPWQLTMARAGV